MTINISAALSLLLLASNHANALNINLCSGEFSKTMPDGTAVKMWGYGVEDGTPTCASATIPGPQITVPVGDPDLNITLRNTLSESVSIIIPGLTGLAGNTPVFLPPDSQGRSRVKSLASETLTGASTLYSFAAKPGTYLYQSGTHPAVQVQMGLYGAATQNATAGEAYSGISHDNEIVMLYSEIDPDMHDAIAGTADNLTAPTYATATGPTSTINYKARYFLVNGEPFTSTAAKLPIGDKGDRVLIRFLNAGLESHAPVLQGQHMSLVAEYGNPYPLSRQQYSILLPAGVTKDAIFTPATSGDFPLYDRRLRLTNSSSTGVGGLMSIMSVAEPVVVNPVIASDDIASTAEDIALLIDVLFNDTTGSAPDATTVEVAAQPANGTAVADTLSGLVAYTPNADFNGLDSFSYTVRNIDSAISNTAIVDVTVTPVNDSPIASDDQYSVVIGSVNTLNVLANDYDVDMDPLTTAIVTGPVLGTVIGNPDGSFDYTAGLVTGTDSFTYTATDPGGLSATATVSVTVVAPVNEPPVANDDYATVTKNNGTLANSVTIIVTANDTDADGTLDLTTVAIGTHPANGTVAVDPGTGNITYTPRAGFRGSDAFSYTINDNAAATSNAATVRVDVLK